MSDFVKHNPKHFTYSDNHLEIDIFGGINPDMTSSLFLTLKIILADDSRPPIRHNLDLYNDNQVNRLITKICERFEVGHSVTSCALHEVTEHLEAERDQLLEQVQPTAKLSEPLSKEEEKTALSSLKCTDLMHRTFKAFEVIGIIGEAFNAMILFLAMLSRKLSDPLSVICTATTGAGKSYLVDKIASILPPQERHECTQLTAASLYHLPKDELAGKVLLIEDLFKAKEAMLPIRGLQSKQRISKTMTIKDRTGDLRAMHFVTEGPLCVVACAPSDKLFAESANRCLLLSLDNSAEQDKKVMDYQKQRKAGLIDLDKATITLQKLTHMQKALKPVKIINPYAPLIDLPIETKYPRQTLPLVLHFIDALTFYHQHQREEKADAKTGEVYLETDPQDIRWAFDLLKKVLFRKSDELSGAARTCYQWLQGWALAKDSFYAHAIREHLKIHPRTLSRHLRELTEHGYLRITGGNKHTTGYSYALAGKATTDGTMDGLNNSISQQLDAVMKKVEAEHARRMKARLSDRVTSDKKDNDQPNSLKNNNKKGRTTPK